MAEPWHILYSAEEYGFVATQHLCVALLTATTHLGRNGSLGFCKVYWILEGTWPMTPPVITLLERLEAREWLPVSIIYMAPGGHRQWPMSALLESCFRHVQHWLVSKNIKGILNGNPDIEVDQRLPLHRQFPTSSSLKWDATSLGNMFPKDTTLIASGHSVTPLHVHIMQFMAGHRDGSAGC